MEVFKQNGGKASLKLISFENYEDISSSKLYLKIKTRLHFCIYCLLLKSEKRISEIIH